MSYVDEVVRQALAALDKNPTPRVMHAVILHEPDCPMVNDGSTCNCTPVVTVCEGEG